MTTIEMNLMPTRLFRQVLVAAAALFGFAAADAQPVSDVPPDMVAPLRLGVVEGGVQFWRPGAEGWETAQVNTAIAQGDAVYTSDDGTAELQVGPRDFVRLRAGTMLTLVTHDQGMMQFSVGSGTASFDLRGDRGGQLVRIDTPNAAIVAGDRGYYRISTRDGETHLVVRHRGSATINFPDGHSQRVAAEEEVVIGGDTGASVATYPAPPPDAWDQWNDARSEYSAAAASNRYVPAGVYGASDLDQYGRWQEDDNYGWIWLPAVVPGWAPYSTGTWQWDPVFGWTWVDLAPWGWTTCHYGRWINIGGHWAWAPGPRAVRVAYAPALVAFFRVDGAVGWVPLGWGEPLLPWWGRPGFRGSVWWGGWGGPRVGVNVEHYHYRNRTVSNAMTTVRDDDFGRHHVHGSDVAMPLGVEPRLIRGNHPIVRTPVREPTMRPDVRDLRRRDGEPPRESRDPRQGTLLGQDRREVRPQVIIPAQRAGEASPPQQRDRADQRERSRFEPQSEAPRPAPIMQPRVIAPVAPVPRPERAPEVRAMPQQPQLPGERRQEERVQRLQPRIEMPAPQVIRPAAPEAPQRAQREERQQREGGGRRDRPRGPGERDQ